MSKPYLILHKVRGSPAFDIATKHSCPVCHADPNVVDFIVPATEDCTNCNGEGFTWGIPTSGHRAYPWAQWKIDDLAWIKDVNDRTPFPCPMEIFNGKQEHGFPSDWPDHYACNDRPIREDTYTVKARATGLLESLGLVRKVEIERRD